MIVTGRDHANTPKIGVPTRYLAPRTIGSGPVERNKGGRPYLGVRKRIPVRVPEKLAEEAQAEAARRGVAFNEFMVQLIASAISNPHRDNQEALQLNLTP